MLKSFLDVVIRYKQRYYIYQKNLSFDSYILVIEYYGYSKVNQRKLSIGEVQYRIKY